MNIKAFVHKLSDLNSPDPQVRRRAEKDLKFGMRYGTTKPTVINPEAVEVATQRILKSDWAKNIRKQNLRLIGGFMSPMPHGITAELDVVFHHSQQIIFAYTNWRDEEHIYTVQPVKVVFGPYNDKGQPAIGEYQWVMHANCLERDGEPRTVGLRTFVMDKMQDVMHVHPREDKP